MKRGLLRGGLTSILIVSFFLPSLSLPFIASAVEDPRTPTGFAPEEPGAFGIGAAGGLAKCVVLSLATRGAAAKELALDLPGLGVVAALSVPTISWPELLQQAKLVSKENLLDCIAGALAKAAIRQLTKSIVNWINSGFQGKPAFLSDPAKFFTDIADEQIGEFIYGSGLAGLCSPFALQVKVLVARSSISSRPVQCTLTKVVKNIQGFTQDFQNGGWPAWLALTTVTANNPYGAFLEARSELDERIARAQAEKFHDVQRGGGFLSFSTCLSRSVTGACLRAQILTPGTVIGRQLNNVLEGPLRQLELADELGEIIDALMVALLQQLFVGQGGLRGLSSVSSFSGFSSGSFSTEVDVVADQETRAGQDLVVQQVDETIDFERKVIDVKEQTKNELTTAQGRLNDLGACYSDKLGAGSGSLTAEQRVTAENRRSNANLGAQALLSRIDAVLGSIDSLNATIADLEIFRSRALSAGELDEVTAVLNVFYVARSKNAFASTFAILEAQRELDSTRTEMQELNRSTDEKLTECFAFPNPS